MEIKPPHELISAHYPQVLKHHVGKWNGCVCEVCLTSLLLSVCTGCRGRQLMVPKDRTLSPQLLINPTKEG